MGKLRHDYMQYILQKIAKGETASDAIQHAMKYIDSNEDYDCASCKEYDTPEEPNVGFYKGDNKFKDIHNLTVDEFESYCEGKSSLAISNMIVSRLTRAFIFKDICKNVCHSLRIIPVTCIIGDDYYFIRSASSGVIVDYFIYVFETLLRNDKGYINGPELSKIIATMMLGCVPDKDKRAYTYKDCYKVTKCLTQVVTTRQLSYTMIANNVYKYINSDLSESEINEKIFEGLLDIASEIIEEEDVGITGLQ